MSCCGKSNSGYIFTLILSEQNNSEEIKNTFSRIFGWNQNKINSIVEIAVQKGECQLFDVGFDEMSRLSKKLAANKIPYKVKKK